MTEESPDTRCELEASSGRMVTVKNAWKSYSGNIVLRGLDMNVKKGQIYSLLGSSGVGKTTLLQAIIGNINLDSGQISVDIKSRLEIGYMPQQLALYNELTLEETFLFFGMILYMSPSNIERRTNELIDLLELPSAHTQICNLSGGQQRRISIAVAMLGNPKFLILDEPTVSLDPLLKESVWRYLIRITKEENKTVIVTTHYIEEANNSDKVGFMNDGKIMLEGSPIQVKLCSDPPLEKLEDVYYYLCTNNHTNSETTGTPKIIEKPIKSLSHLSDYNTKRILAFVLKTIFYIRRNLLIFYFFLFSPAMMVMILAEVLAKPKSINLGYVNFESNCSDYRLNCTAPLSCRLIDKLRQMDYTMTKYESIEEGQKGVERNHVWALVRFNWNFSEGVENRLDYFYAAEHVEVAEDDEARVWLDMSSYPISHMVKKAFYDTFLESIEDWYDNCGWNKRAAHPILRMHDPIYGKFEEGIISTGIPTVVIIMTFCMSMLLSLMFVLTEKELGTLQRCRVNGLKTYELLISIFVTCFLCKIPTGLALLLIQYLYTGPTNGPVFWSSLIFYWQTVNGIITGILVGLHTNKIAAALQGAVGILYGLTLVSGMLWPIQGAHWIAKIVYNIAPPGIPSGVYALIANKGFDDLIYLALICSIVWTVILILLIIITLKIKNENS